MKLRDAVNRFINNGGRIRKKDWKEGNFIMFNKGRRIFTKDNRPLYTSDRGFYDQDGKNYKTLDKLLSSVGIDINSVIYSEEDDYDYEQY